MQGYRDTLRRQSEEERRRHSARGAQARALAKRAATLLKEQFGTQRVAVFGSAAVGGPLYPSLDVDLAVWGLSATAHLEAVARLHTCSSSFSVDLIRMERCPSGVRDVVLQEGVER